MSNNQPLDYRLRVATKRTDLPEDVIRLLADAYYEIWLGKERVQVLQDKCDSLLSTNVELEVRIKSIKEGFEGCCTACEPVGEINKKLREERDEARRYSCDLEARIIVLEEDRRDTSNKFGTNPCSEIILPDYPLAREPKEIAKQKGWDCYKNNFLQDLG